MFPTSLSSLPHSREESSHNFFSSSHQNSLAWLQAIFFLILFTPAPGLPYYSSKVLLQVSTFYFYISSSLFSSALPIIHTCPRVSLDLVNLVYIWSLCTRYFWHSSLSNLQYWSLDTPSYLNRLSETYLVGTLVAIHLAS